MGAITTTEQLRQVLPEPRKSVEAKILDHLDEQALAFLARAPFAALATISADGRIEVSPKGDAPGFIQAEDERTLLLPERAGNNLAFGLQAIIANPNVALMIVVPGTGETLRVSGTAEVRDDPELVERLSEPGKPALLATRIRVRHAFFHCARAFLRAGLWKPESWPERQKVSFGKVIARQMQAGDDVAREIDDRVADGYANRLYEN